MSGALSWSGGREKDKWGWGGELRSPFCDVREEDGGRGHWADALGGRGSLVFDVNVQRA